MFVAKTDVRTACLRLFKEPSPSFVAASGRTGYEALRREIPDTHRTDDEIRAAQDPAQLKKVERQMSRLDRVGAFTGVLALSYEDQLDYDTSEVLDTRAFVAGVAWGVVSDRPGRGGSIAGRRSQGQKVLRLQQLDMCTVYRDSGIEGALVSDIVDASRATVVGIDVPADNEFASARYERLGMRVVGSTNDRNYFGRHAEPATILHFEGDAEQVMDAAAQWTPEDMEIIHERDGFVPVHFMD